VNSTKKIAPLTLSAIIALSSCNKLPDQKFPEINVMPGSGYTYQMSSAEAKRNLYALAKKSLKEDSWLIYNGRVYDVGTDEKELSSRLDIEKIKFFLTTDPPRAKQVVLAHIHPVESTGTKYVIPPSPEDWANQARLQRYLKKEFDLDLKSWVIDYRGVWEMRSDESFFSNPSNLGSRINQTVFDIKFKIIGNDKLSKDEKAEAIIKLTRERTGIEMTYRPIEF
jgi:hypothetical protein